MLIKQTPILKAFKCVGAQCPANCCRGWKIPIDDETYMKYITQKGTTGFVLRCFIDKKEELTSFRCGRSYRCPFWGRDRLCGLQKRYGESFMPRVCVEFPRQLSNYGDFCEETLYLACPEAARLFIEQARRKIPFGFEEAQGDVHYSQTSTNDDMAFLDYLARSRGELIQMLENGCGLNTIFIKYAQTAQEKCLEYGKDGHGAGFGSSKLPLPSPLDFKISDGKIFRVSAAQMHTLFFKGFYHPSLARSSPALHKLCAGYIREFYALTKNKPDKADEKLSALMDSVYGYVPDFDALMVAYFEHFLINNFLDIFEDYCFTRNILLGLSQACMLRLFVALYCKENLKGKGELSIRELSVIIALYERRAPQIKDAFDILIADFSDYSD